MAAIEQRSTITSLPNEILAQILECLPAKSLLPLAGVSRHFCASILDILQARLLWLASLDSHTLEVYWGQVCEEHVSFYAEYIDTPGLFRGQGEENLGVVEHLARLLTLYSRYKAPTPPVESSRTTAGENKVPENMLSTIDENTVFFNLTGDDEMDRITPSLNYIPDNLHSMADIVLLEGDDGDVHLSQDWLNEQADRQISGTRYPDGGKDISWVNGENNVGFKFRVERKESQTVEPENTEVVTTNYVLHIEELRIRPVYMLLMRNKHYQPRREIPPLDP